jgi:hypothetical protein
MSFWYGPIEVGKMTPSGLEYFGSEQHEYDMKNIVSNQTDPLQILGKIQGDWEYDLETACKTAKKVLYTQREHHSDYLYQTVLSDQLPTISKIPKLIGFKTTQSHQIQMQRPGCLLSAHTDPPNIYKNSNCIRVLVTLAPWEYGQIIMFNNRILQHWEAGTILYTRFENTMHATFNASFHTRPLLQITGEPDENLQALINSNKEQIFQL